MHLYSLLHNKLGPASKLNTHLWSYSSTGQKSGHDGVDFFGDRALVRGKGQKMTKWIKASATKPVDLSLIPKATR